MDDLTMGFLFGAVLVGLLWACVGKSKAASAASATATCDHDWVGGTCWRCGKGK